MKAKETLNIFLCLGTLRNKDFSPHKSELFIALYNGLNSKKLTAAVTFLYT